MRASVLVLAFLLFGVWHGSALAQGSVEERLQRMEQRIRYPEQRVAAQDRTIVEVELSHENAYDGSDPNDLAAGTVDLAVAARVNGWTGAEVALTADDDGKIEVDERIVTLQEPDSPVAFKGGRMGVAFGVFESNMISVPLTDDMASVSDDAIQIELDLDRLNLALEWARLQDYSVGDGGTGKDATKATADLAQAKYRDSLTSARDLEQAVNALVARPTQANLAAARRAWTASRVPCQQGEVYRFGNATVDDWEGKVNAWPLDEGPIDCVASSYGAESEENPGYRANVIANRSFALAGKTIDKALLESLHEVGGGTGHVRVAR